MSTKTLALVTSGIALAGVLGATTLTQPCSKEVGEYAQIDKDGIVQTVIVADECFIQSGRVGDASDWVFTDYSVPEKAAAIGGKYDARSDRFITKEDVNKYGRNVKVSDIQAVSLTTEKATTTKP